MMDNDSSQLYRLPRNEDMVKLQNFLQASGEAESGGLSEASGSNKEYGLRALQSQDRLSTIRPSTPEMIWVPAKQTIQPN